MLMMCANVWSKMVLMKSKFWKTPKKSTHIVWTFNAKRDDREEIIQSCTVDEEGISYDVVMTRAVKTSRANQEHSVAHPETHVSQFGKILAEQPAGSGPKHCCK